MKPRFLYISVLLLFALPAFDQARQDANANAAPVIASAEQSSATEQTEDEIKVLEAERSQALVRGDVRKLDELLAPEFVEINTAGNVRTKADNLAGHQQGKTHWQTFDLDQQQVRVAGETAVVSGRVTRKGTFDGRDMSGQSNYTRYYLKRNGHWQAIFQYSVPALAAQTATAQQPVRRKTSAPYKGDLTIFENADRDKKLQVERVMDILGIHSGASVADIGAGSGWFTVRAAKRVGTRGTVYAVDINPEAIKYIDERARKEAIANIRTVLGSEDDPKLPDNSVNSVLILKTYHEIAEPVRLLVNLRRSLRSGARIGIIDRNGNGGDHGIQKDVVEQEATQAGYRLVGS